jgi:hypothetical protein
MKKKLTLLKKTWGLSLCIIVSFLINQTADAATLSSGVLTLNLDREALKAGLDLDNYPDTPIQVPSIYLEEFFDASAANKPYTEIRDSLTPIDPYDVAANEIPATNLKFKVNGASIPPNPFFRRNQATDFSFETSDVLGTATGNIGLNGVLRFRVDVTPPFNRVLLGDMSLAYNRVLDGVSPGRSGWTLTNHIGFDAGAFELFNVTTTLNGNILNLNGDLGFGNGFDHLGARDARLAQSIIGNFSFQATVVPVPAAVWLFLTGVLNMLWLGRRHVALNGFN